MKIIFFTLVPSPHLYELHMEMALHSELTLQVVYELPNSPKRDWGNYIPNCDVLWLQSKKFIGISSLIDFSLNRVLDRLEADLVVIGTSPWSVNTWLIRKWANKKSIPYIIFSEAPNLNRTWLNKQVKKIIGEKLLNDSVAFAGVTRKVCEIVAELYSFSGPTFVLPYHRYLSPFYSLPTRLNRNNIPKFIFIGELTARKNVGLVIDAFKSITDPFEFHIVGDGALRESLERAASAVNNGSISFGDKCPFDGVHELIKDYDYLILPSTHDGFGMVVVEALAAGIPVIASDKVMSAVEFVTNRFNGWLFQSGDKNSLSSVLSLAIESQDTWQELSCNARLSLKDYDAKISADRFASFIKSIT